VAAEAIHVAVEVAIREVAEAAILAVKAAAMDAVAAVMQAADARPHLVNPAAAAAAQPSAAEATSATEQHSCRPDGRMSVVAVHNDPAAAIAWREGTDHQRCHRIARATALGRVPVIAHQHCLLRVPTWVEDPVLLAVRAFLHFRLLVPVPRLVRDWPIVWANVPQRCQAWVTGGHTRANFPAARLNSAAMPSAIG
jgi:hypothetical protein